MNQGTLKSPPNLGLQPFVILLERDAARVHHVHSHILKTLPSCQIWPATDSRDSAVDQFLARGRYRIARSYRAKLTRGKLACTISHLRLWETLAAGPIQRALILEDDARLEPGFSGALAAALQEIPQDFHLLYLFIHPKHYQPQRPLLPGKRFITPHYFSWGRVGYVLSKEGARRLLQHFRVLAAHGDIMINRAVEAGDLKAYMCHPQIVTSAGQVSSHAESACMPSNIWGTPPIRGFWRRRLGFIMQSFGKKILGRHETPSR